MKKERLYFRDARNGQTILAKAETAEAKEEVKKAVEVGKEAINYAQRLYQINKELERVLIEEKKQPRERVLETLKSPLPADLYSFVAKSPEVFLDKLKQLDNRLDILGESFQK